MNQIESTSAGAQIGAMKNAAKFAMVLVTTPNLKTARRLAKLALEARLIACANVVPKLESHYWWQGSITASAEVLMMLKTGHSHLGRLEKLILEHHPYDTPEFIVVQLAGGTDRYLQWLAAECASN